MGDVDWYPMTPVSLIESAEPSFSLAFGEGYPEVRILKDFKFNGFLNADSKRVTGAFFASADSKRFRAKLQSGRFRKVAATINTYA
jgi:hypothetical protein